MELSSGERFLLELVQEKNQQAHEEIQRRMIRFLTGIQERLRGEGIDIPLEDLAIDPLTGEITDRRSSDEHIESTLTKGGTDGNEGESAAGTEAEQEEG